MNARPFTASFARPGGWLLLSASVLWLDHITGPSIQFPIAFAVPVALAGWGGGYRSGMAIAIALPAASVALGTGWALPTFELVANAAVSIIVLATLGVLARRARELSGPAHGLANMLPICSFCKRVRAAHGCWEHSGTRFSHGLCPDCLAEHYPDAETDQRPH